MTGFPGDDDEALNRREWNWIFPSSSWPCVFWVSPFLRCGFFHHPVSYTTQYTIFEEWGSRTHDLAHVDGLGWVSAAFPLFPPFHSKRTA